VTCNDAIQVTIYSCRNSALGRAYAAEYGPDIDPHAVWRMAEFVREDISRAEGELLAKRMNSIVVVTCAVTTPCRLHAAQKSQFGVTTTHYRSIGPPVGRPGVPCHSGESVKAEPNGSAAGTAEGLRLLGPHIQPVA
jgi:hypothetical protein